MSPGYLHSLKCLTENCLISRCPGGALNSCPSAACEQVGYRKDVVAAVHAALPEGGVSGSLYDKHAYFQSVRS